MLRSEIDARSLSLSLSSCLFVEQQSALSYICFRLHSSSSPAGAKGSSRPLRPRCFVNVGSKFDASPLHRALFDFVQT